MKKLRAIFLILALVMCSPLFLACGNKAQIKVLKRLATPTNIEFDEATCVVSWDAVSNADFYNVKINDKAHQCLQTQFDITEFVAENGEYTINVSANSFSSEYIESATSDSVYLTKKGKWDTPTICYDTDESTIYWEAIPGAIHYTLVVNNIEFETTETSFCVLERTIFYDVLVNGQNTFAVYCSTTSDNLNSDLSNVVTVTIIL